MWNRMPFGMHAWSIRRLVISSDCLSSSYPDYVVMCSVVWIITSATVSRPCGFCCQAAKFVDVLTCWMRGFLEDLENSNPRLKYVLYDEIRLNCWDKMLSPRVMVGLYIIFHGSRILQDVNNRERRTHYFPSGSGLVNILQIVFNQDHNRSYVRGHIEDSQKALSLSAKSLITCYPKNGENKVILF